MSLRGADPASRPRKKMPTSLEWTGARRHELAEPIANAHLCDVLGQLAIHGDCGAWITDAPIVEAFHQRYALTGTLVDGNLYDLRGQSSIPPLNIRGCRMIDAKTKRDLGSAIEHVRYVMPRRAAASEGRSTGDRDLMAPSAIETKPIDLGE